VWHICHANAVDAADSSVGRFSQPGAVARFVAEAADKLARLHGDPLTAKTFANMRIIIVGYSGGFLPTAYSLSIGGDELEHLLTKHDVAFSRSAADVCRARAY
jgi:hypothetical protein